VALLPFYTPSFQKYLGIINVYTSIIFDYTMKEIRLCNDGGRLTRPILRVDKKNQIFQVP
jgi:hypothetical protein